MGTVYDKLKNLTFEEMRSFVYWVYMNGVLDGSHDRADSWGGFFGGEFLEKEANNLPDNIDNLWDLYEEAKQKYYAEQNEVG